MKQHLQRHGVKLWTWLLPKSFELIKTLVFKPKTAKTATPIPVVVIARDETETSSGALGKRLNLKELFAFDKIRVCLFNRVNLDTPSNESWFQYLPSPWPRITSRKFSLWSMHQSRLHLPFLQSMRSHRARQCSSRVEISHRICLASKATRLNYKRLISKLWKPKE